MLQDPASISGQEIHFILKLLCVNVSQTSLLLFALYENLKSCNHSQTEKKKTPKNRQETQQHKKPPNKQKKPKNKKQ